MTLDIRPLNDDDLPELSRFLTAGFHAAPDAPFADPEVLRWKFLPDGKPDGQPLSYIARDDSGPIVGHVGVCRTAFVGKGIETPVETLHMIDWLGSKEHPSVGASLMRRAHASAPTQFGLGGSDAGRAVIERGGYDMVGRIPVYQIVLRPTYWLRAGGLSVVQRWPRLIRDLARRIVHLYDARPTDGPVTLKRVDSFGKEIFSIIDQYGGHAILTDRSPGRLNSLLRFPGQNMTGWHLLGKDEKPIGFAILNVVPQDGGKTRIGKVVDCVLNTTDVERWTLAFIRLADQLDIQGADLAQAYAGAPWLERALKAANFTTRFALDFRLRDRAGRVPREGPFHIMPIEADYAYT